MKFYITVGLIIALLLIVYYFSFQLQVALATFINWIGKRLGSFSKEKELELQKYVFMHRNSLIAKLYNFLNEQLITLGLKIVGVTPLGFLVFWSIIALILSVLVTLLLNFGVFGVVPLFFMLLAFELILIRVSISEKMEKREGYVMDAIDLIIPELSGGVKNAILMHKDNFAPMLMKDFNDFDININQRKMSFNNAMILLADSLGLLFRDFAQKAISYEASGEADMLDIFVETIETNRLRRELRDVTNKTFSEASKSFVVSSVLMIAYALYSIMTDEFTRELFLYSPIGKVIALVMVADTVGVLCFITTLKSKPM